MYSAKGMSGWRGEIVRPRAVVQVVMLEGRRWGGSSWTDATGKDEKGKDVVVGTG